MHRLTQYEGFCYCTFLVYCVLCKCPSEASITLLLPLLRDPAHSAATVRHVMDKIKQTVSFLNPGQVPIMTADQPIYVCSGKASPVALAWTIWWRQVHHHVWRPAYRDGCTEGGSRVGFFWNSRISVSSWKQPILTIAKRQQRTLKNCWALTPGMRSANRKAPSFSSGT